MTRGGGRRSEPRPQGKARSGGNDLKMGTVLGGVQPVEDEIPRHRTRIGLSTVKIPGGRGKGKTGRPKKCTEKSGFQSVY